MPKANGLWYEWRGRDDGDIVMLSPGLGGSGSYWEPNVAALGARYRILLYDHRGTGRSDRALPDDLSVEAMADDLIGLMDAIGVDRAHLIGHAAGGVIGLALALKAPERLGKLIIVNGWSTLDPHFARCFDVRLELLRKSGPEAYVRAQPIFLFPAPWISLNSARLDAEAASHVAHFPPSGNVEMRISALRDFDVDARLGEIATPVLALASADDMLVPAFCSERLANGIKGARLAVMKWGGHACNVTDPHGFDTHVLDFLRS
jgi:aminoacrylate hydrolase